MRIVLLALAATFCAAAHAQYPSKPVRWLVPSAAGGAGVLGMEQGAKAPPDGYTLLTAGTSQLIFNPYFHAKLPYNPQKDYAPVALLADLPIALWVHSSIPAASLGELIKYSKANPEKLNYGSSGVGHIFHLAMEMLASRTGLQATPWNGTCVACRPVREASISMARWKMWPTPDEP